MDMYKAKIQSDGSLDKLKLIIVVRGDLHNKEFVEDPEKYEPVPPCMDVYKAKIQSDGSLDKLKLTIVVRGVLQNK